MNASTEDTTRSAHDPAPDAADPYEAAFALFSGGRSAQALARLDSLILAQPSNVQALNLAAICLVTLNRKPEAAAYWRRAVEADPQDAQAHNNLGNVQYELGDFCEAQASFNRAIAIDPRSADGHRNLGWLLHMRERYDEAEACYRRALALRDDDAVILNDLACLLNKLDRHAQAETCARQASHIDPASADIQHTLGCALFGLGRWVEAQAAFQQTLVLRPGDANAHRGLGAACFESGDLAQSEDAYRRALAIHPDDADLCSSLGFILVETGRHEEAEAFYRRAVVLHENHATLNDLGFVLYELRRMHEAQSCYRRALEWAPGSAQISMNLALCLLAMGRFEEGWPLWEARYDPGLKSRNTVVPDLPFPQWQGEPLDGKSLLVLHEQGHGDSLQFARYLPMLRERGVAHLSVACPPALKRLLETVEGVDACVPLAGDHAMRKHDYWCFMMSLPGRFGTTLRTIPAAVPYVRVPAPCADAWHARVPAGAFKVGLVWAGDPRLWQTGTRATTVDRRRSLDATALLPLLQTEGVTFVSLQKGETTRGQIEKLAPQWRPHDVMDDVQDFADTAAIVDRLDLVITVDTSVAHLAGALGKPVWILSRFDGCWRWLDDRDDTPWYPDARLFRQVRPGDWNEVIARVTRALQACVAGKGDKA
ncbi:Tetratricopeptide repeat protein [Paraburkholderia unamae]|uniref:tetratricopeptide repeat protein n=1 Tax=Paraburkholderia unamae TaxID=219649 RepID=UPI001CAE2DDF|nr:tetratricopeptide repeat protein [Paraburkholderia unamae]CAG9249903.1 Tetratricopeptide repeat protein [Paraburkholderia unamae]